MDRYQFLALEIKVPSDWPVREFYHKIKELVDNAITHYLAGKRVIATVGNVSALVTENEHGTEYIFRRIQEVPYEQTYKIYLILPTSVLMFKPNLEETDNANIQILLDATNLTFHSLTSNSLQTGQSRFNMTIAVPNLKKILQSKAIKGKEIYSCLFKSTYRFHGNIQLPIILQQFTVDDNPAIFETQVSDYEWDVVCVDQIPKPIWRRYNWKKVTFWTGYCVILASSAFLMYFLLAKKIQIL